MPFDPSNKAHKAQLYPVLKALADLDPRKTPELILDEAVGYAIPHGADYARNMRRGEINKTFAMLAYQWLMGHHFTLAHRISPEIFPMTPEMHWREVLEERTITGQLKLIPMKAEMGVVQRASMVDAAETTLKLGQRFYLELISEVAGHAIALQGIRDQWHGIPLGRDGAVSIEVQAGVNFLPQAVNGLPDPLIEQHDLGGHEFVVVVGVRGDIPAAIGRLVEWVRQEGCKMHSVKVRFVE